MEMGMAEVVDSADSKPVGVEVVTLSEYIEPSLVFVIGAHPDSSKRAVLDTAARGKDSPVEMVATFTNVEVAVAYYSLDVGPDFLEVPPGVYRASSEGVGAKTFGEILAFGIKAEVAGFHFRSESLQK